MSVEDNLEVVSRLKSVSGSDVAIVNASYDEDARKILLDIEGKTPGNADLVVALKNGDWQVCTNLSVVVFSGGNLALGKSITESHVSATGTPLSEAERQMLRHLSMVLNRLRVMEVPILIIFGVDRRGRIIQNLRW